MYDEKYEESIKKESLVLLLQKITTATFVVVFFSIGIYYVMRPIISEIVSIEIVIIWFILMIGINIYRAIYAQIFIKNLSKKYNKVHTVTIFFTYSIAIISSIAISYLIYQGVGSYENLLIAYIFGTFALIPHTLSTNYALSKNYIMIMGLPAIIIFFMKGDETNIMLSFILLFFMLVSMRLAKINHTSFRELLLTTLTLSDSNKEIEARNVYIQESIDYAFLIQKSILPNNSLLVLNKYFDDSFVFWQPMDTIGGDIYFINELDSKDEVLIMNIDCIGHGVAGAFLTILAKEIHSRAIFKINNNTLSSSPKAILEYFHNRITMFLGQDENLKSSMGFDGQVLYFNATTKEIVISSAKNDILYIQNNELKIIKADKQSIPYRQDNGKFSFTEHKLKSNEISSLYLSTDGYIDQLDDDKHIRFGKTKLKKIIENIYKKNMSTQKDILIDELKTYKKDTKHNDDISFIGLKTISN